MMLAGHSPLDRIIIMLGANDLKAQFCPTVHGVGACMGRLIGILRSFPCSWVMWASKILIVSPPHFEMRASGEGPQSGRRIEEGRKLAGAHAEIGRAQGGGVFDVAPHVTASPVDGVSLDVANTRALGAALIAPLRGISG